MTKATSIQLASGVDVLAYLFQSGGTQWICLRSQSAAAGRGWLECWNSKGGSAPDVSAALRAVRAIVADNLKSGPLGTYLEGAHFIPEWNVWGGATPGPIAQYRPAEVAANSGDPVDLAQYLSQLDSTSG